MGLLKNRIKWISLLVYPFFILYPYVFISAQTSDFKKAYQATLNLDYKKSTAFLNNLPTDNVLFGELYIANLNEVLELIFSENQDRYNQLIDNEAIRIQAIEESKLTSPYKAFIAAEIKLQWAFVKLKFGNTLRGVWSLRRAYKTIEDNIATYPEFTLNYKTMGLLQVVFGAVPNNQQWVLNILGLEGNVQNGLKQLQLLSETDTPFQVESLLLSAMIQSYLLERHSDGLLTLNKINSSRKTLAEVYISSLILMKAHQSKEARHLLALTIDQNKELAPPLFNYLLAESLFQGAEYKKAKVYYLEFLSHFDGKNQLRDSKMKVAICEYHLGNIIAFESYWQQAKRTEGATSEADKTAENLLDSDEYPNFSLLQIRYAIDGGYYSIAREAISQLNTKQLKPGELFELEYRKARLAHLTGDLEKALTGYYIVTSSSDSFSKTYFMPNSYLQTGYLQLEKGDTAKAKISFTQVLNFDDHAYKSSLDSKAKIALSAISGSGD